MSANPTPLGPHRNSSQLNQDPITQRTNAQPEYMTHANHPSGIVVAAHSGTPPLGTHSHHSA
jgi:hypothetical protein